MCLSLPIRRLSGSVTDLHQGSVAHVDGEPVEPAGHRVLGVAFGPGGERRAAVRAAVGDGVHLPANPLEQDPFPHDHLAFALPFFQFVAEQGRIPVVAQAQLRLQVIRIRLQALVCAVDIVFHFSDRNVSHEFQPRLFTGCWYGIIITMSTRFVSIGFFALSLLLTACDRSEAPQGGGSAEAASAATASARAAGVTDERLVNAEAEPHNWLNHGRTYDEQRFSPLEQINDGNVKQLKLAWYLDLPSKRGLEATPLVADGRMYTTGTWSRVYAVDAASGELLWEYDPQVPPQKGHRCLLRRGEPGCCAVARHGLCGRAGRAADRAGRHERRGSLVGADHARRPALHHNRPRRASPAARCSSATAARNFDARGFVTAYDAATGEQVWRFYTVPGDPALPFENPILEQAAQTWTGEWWKFGGGGTVWDAISYDPELNLVYIGVGNGTPVEPAACAAPAAATTCS